MKDFNNIPADFDDLAKYAPFLLRTGKENCFTVPEGYFDELPAIIQHELLLRTIKGQNPFVVPHGYFEAITEQIDQEISLDVLKKENVFDVPENYFEELSQKLQSSIFVESINKEEWDVPEGYFDKLIPIVQNRISKEKREIKIISILKWTKKRYAYVAVAASIALLIGIVDTFKKIAVTPVIEKEMSIALNESDKKFIIDHHEMYNIDESLLAEQVSEEGITELSLQGLTKDEVLNYLSKDSGSELNAAVDDEL